MQNINKPEKNSACEHRYIYYAKYYARRGGGKWSAGEKNQELGKKMKGGKKKEANYIKKKGEKALKIHLFGI